MPLLYDDVKRPSMRRSLRIRQRVKSLTDTAAIRIRFRRIYLLFSLVHDVADDTLDTPRPGGLSGLRLTGGVSFL